MLFTWGLDIYGRLGHNTETIEHKTNTDLAVPKEVIVMKDITVSLIACGAAHNVVATTSPSKVYTWGKCHRGQLGHGELDKDEHIPVSIPMFNDIDVISISCGDSHNILITAEHKVFVWGIATYGALGSGKEVNLSVPFLLESDLFSNGVVSSAAGSNHSLILDSTGSVFVFGRNNCGQLGLVSEEVVEYNNKGVKEKVFKRRDKKVPQRLPVHLPVKQVAACECHSLLLLEDGSILSFGKNDFLQLGRESDEKKEEITVPLICSESFVVKSPPGMSFNQISTSYFHSLAISKDSTLYTWGFNSSGECCLNHYDKVPFPTAVEFPKKIVNAKCGKSFTVAIADGLMYNCGKWNCELNPDISSSANLERVIGLSSKDDKGDEIPMPHHTIFNCGGNHIIVYL